MYGATRWSKKHRNSSAAITATVPKPTGFWNSPIKQKHGFRSTVHPAYLPGENYPIKTISEYQILELI
jgi:hypothetical protein